MSSFKILKRDCSHTKGYRNADDKCPDCGATAKPSTQIEHFHQKLLQRYVDEQGALAGTSVNIPMAMMCLLRVQALEMYLDRQHALAEAVASPIVSLQ